MGTSNFLSGDQGSPERSRVRDPELQRGANDSSGAAQAERELDWLTATVDDVR